MGLLDDDAKRNALNMGLLQAGLGILAANDGRRSGMSAIGLGGLRGLQGYQSSMNEAQEQAKELQAQKAKQAEAQSVRQWFLQAQQKKGADPATLQRYSMMPDSTFLGMKEQMVKSFMPKDPMKLGQHDRLVDPNAGYKELARGMGKPGFDPVTGLMTPEKFSQEEALNRAKGTSVSFAPQIDVHAGKSVAGQIGGMLKDERIKATGAINTYRTANQLLQALDSDKVIAGPFANKLMKVEQLLSVVGAGDPEKLKATRTAIRSLAEQAVEARKLLAGQGQVTENEAKAVEKAQSGQIDELTTEELRLIAQLNLKASRFTAQQYNHMLNNLPASARDLRSMFELQGIGDVLAEPKQSAPSGGVKFLGFE